MELKNQIEAIIVEIAGAQEVNKSADLLSERVIGWDSLRQAEFMIKLQRTFNVKFTYNELSQLASLDAVLRLLQRKLTQK